MTEPLRTFRLYRGDAPAGYAEMGFATESPADPQLEGVVFSDGTVAVRWLTAYRSTSLWPDFASFEAVHGHPEYVTELRWNPDDLGGGQVEQLRAVPAEDPELRRLLRELYSFAQEAVARHGTSMVNRQVWVEEFRRWQRSEAELLTRVLQP